MIFSLVSDRESRLESGHDQRLLQCVGNIQSICLRDWGTQDPCTKSQLIVRMRNMACPTISVVYSRIQFYQTLVVIPICRFRPSFATSAGFSSQRIVTKDNYISKNNNSEFDNKSLVYIVKPFLSFCPQRQICYKWRGLILKFSMLENHLLSHKRRENDSSFVCNL